MGVANWFKNFFKGKETLDAHNLESKVDINLSIDGIDYFLVLIVLNKKLVKYVYYKDGYEPIEVDLDDPDNIHISEVVDRAIEEFMKL